MPWRIRLGVFFAVAILFGVSLQACLTGGGDSGGGGDLAKAEARLASGRCTEAASAFEAAIASDSTKSAAYLGLAKAELCRGGIDYKTLYDALVEYMLADSVSDTNFFGRALKGSAPDTILTRYLQASAKAQAALRLLEDRDTLTLYWGYLDGVVTAEEAADTSYATRRARMQAYFAQAGQDVPGYRPLSSFPLSDRKILLEEYYGLLGATAILHMNARVWDLDQDGVIDFSTLDSLTKKLQLGGSGGHPPDSMVDWGGLDSATTKNLNDLIAGMQKGLDSSLINLFPPPGDTTNLDSALELQTGTVLFYQFGDGKDNDGDGCVDEEILDEKDNDGDGFVDEDARVVRADGRDNDRDGAVDGASEDTAGVAVNAIKPWLLGFVNAWAAANPDSLFITIRKGDANIALRVAIQADSLATKSPSDLAGPLKAKLDSAKALVGGCWRNYP